MNTAPQESEPIRDAGVYLLLYPTSEGLKFATFDSKKAVNAALEKLGPERLDSIKLFKGAKEVEVRTKVSFTF